MKLSCRQQEDAEDIFADTDKSPHTKEARKEATQYAQVPDPFSSPESEPAILSSPQRGTDAAELLSNLKSDMVTKSDPVEESKRALLRKVSLHR